MPFIYIKSCVVDYFHSPPGSLFVKDVENFHDPPGSFFVVDNFHDPPGRMRPKNFFFVSPKGGSAREFFFWAVFLLQGDGEGEGEGLQCRYRWLREVRRHAGGRRVVLSRC